jgi:hypothetical protein
MSFHQCVSDENTVGIALEDCFTLENNPTDSINGGGYYVTREFSDILVTIRAVIVTGILVKSKVELCAMLNNCTIER